jgi:F-type H+-transporting ATPase subunit c
MMVFANILPDLMVAETTGAGLQYLGAGIATIGMLGAGIGQGMAAQGACMAVGRNPEVTSKIRTVMIIGSGIAESGAIYALIIGVLLLFAV